MAVLENVLATTYVGAWRKHPMFAFGFFVHFDFVHVIV
jgi:hypothetical protein